MAWVRLLEVAAVQLVIYYKYKDTKDGNKVKTGTTHLTSTEEVIAVDQLCVR